MRGVVTLTVAAAVALVAAVFTGSSWAAVAVVVLATAGIVVLVRGWRAERAAGATAPPTRSADSGPLRPDEFSPDISEI